MNALFNLLDFEQVLQYQSVMGKLNQIQDAVMDVGKRTLKLSFLSALAGSALILLMFHTEHCFLPRGTAR